MVTLFTSTIEQISYAYQLSLKFAFKVMQIYLKKDISQTVCS